MNASSKRQTKSTNLMLALLCSMGLGACMTNPSDDGVIESRRVPLSFSGWTFWAGDKITIQARNRINGTYLTLGSTTSSTKAQSDAQGYSWFTWATNFFSLPTSTSYWEVIGKDSNRRNTIELIANSQKYGASMWTYAPSSANCLANVFLSNGGGMDYINQCATGQSVNLESPCGDRMEGCCISGAACAAGLACKNDLCVPSGDSVITTKPPTITTGPTCAEMSGGPCMTTPSECSEGGSQVVGVWQCVNGHAQCKVTAGVDYCAGCDNNLCGGCAQSSCMTDEQCAPGTVCNQFTKVCTPIGGNCRPKEGFCYPVKDSFMAPPPPGAQPQNGCIGF